MTATRSTAAPRRAPRRPRANRARLAALAPALAATIAIGGCSTTHPGEVNAGTLAEAQTFPYYRVYWAGPTFDGYPLAAVEGTKGYKSWIGDSVYYGDCSRGSGVFGGSGCPLPLQVTTLIYQFHKNSVLGEQRNIVLRGVPAVAYDEGRSLELYSGDVAIDIFSDSLEHAIEGALRLYPVNAPGSADADLPPPVFCPELAPPVPREVAHVMADLPGRVCQQVQAAMSFAKSLKWKYP